MCFMHERRRARLAVDGAATLLQTHGSLWRMERGETRSKADGWNHPGRLKSEPQKGLCVCVCVFLHSDGSVLFLWQPLCFFFRWAGVLFVSLSSTSLFKSPLLLFPFSDSPCALELTSSHTHIPPFFFPPPLLSPTRPQTVEEIPADPIWNHVFLKLSDTCLNLPYWRLLTDPAFRTTAGVLLWDPPRWHRVCPFGPSRASCPPFCGFILRVWSRGMCVHNSWSRPTYSM